MRIPDSELKDKRYVTIKNSFTVIDLTDPKDQLDYIQENFKHINKKKWEENKKFIMEMVFHGLIFAPWAFILALIMASSINST